MDRYNYYMYYNGNTQGFDWKVEPNGRWVKWEDVKALSVKLEEAEQEREAAMTVLAPNMPESGLVDACKQVKQVAISEADNSDKFEAKLHEVEAERDAARSSRDGLSESLHNAVMLMQASRGEIVKACPLCDAHNPSWDDEDACWFCVECGQHIDEVHYWQKVKGPQL